MKKRVDKDKLDILEVAGTPVRAGESREIQLHISRQYDYTDVFLPLRVIRGRSPGPGLFVCAAIHGDEINGVEIIRRLLRHRALKSLRGTLIAVPIVNVFGFNSNSRYLPDRRDLNRSFPGSPNGSLASRIAHLFVDKIMVHCQYGIDLHTAAGHRNNLPQIRGDLKNPAVKKMAMNFGATVVLDASIRDGSLREAGADRKIPVLIYEGGEALRFNEVPIRLGVQGILRVMRCIGMLPENHELPMPVKKTEVASGSYWVRANASGIFTTKLHIGAHVKKGQVLGHTSDTFGHRDEPVKALEGGLIVGQHELPLVNRGDALFHIATFEGTGEDKVLAAMISSEYHADRDDLFDRS